MKNDSNQAEINTLIIETLSTYPKNVYNLAIKAIQLAEELSVIEVAEVLKFAVKEYTKE